MASAEQQVMQNQMAQRDAQSAMNVRNELSQQQVGHERQMQELQNSLETGQRRQVQEVESRSEQYVMAERQQHEQELRHVRQSYVAQRTPVPMESEPVIEPKKAIKHTATPTATPPVKSKAQTMPSESKLALPPAEVTTSSRSSKQLTQGTARNRSTSRKGTKTETNEPEGLPKRGRASTVEEKPIEETQTKKRAVSEDTGKKMLVPSLIGIQAVREALENAKNKGVLGPEQSS